MGRLGFTDDLGITSVAEAMQDQASVSTAQTTERAHALKNCAAVILAITRLTPPDLPSPHRERFGRLREAATRLVRLLNDELREAVAEDLETARLLEAACDLVHDRAEARGVMLIVSGAGGHVRGDARALEEVLVNLIGNAVDASSAGQIVRVAARALAGGGHQWLIEDAGDGMPAHVLAGLGGVVRSARPLGSGFGISLAARTIQAHGGTLRFESLRPRGTRVVVNLPLRPEAILDGAGAFPGPAAPAGSPDDGQRHAEGGHQEPSRAAGDSDCRPEGLSICGQGQREHGRALVHAHPVGDEEEDEARHPDQPARRHERGDPDRLPQR